MRKFPYDRFYDHLNCCKKCYRTCSDAITMEKWQEDILKHMGETGDI